MTLSILLATGMYIYIIFVQICYELFLSAFVNLLSPWPLTSVNGWIHLKIWVRGQWLHFLPALKYR